MDLGVLEGQTRGGYFLDSIFDPSVNQCTGHSPPVGATWGGGPQPSLRRVEGLHTVHREEQVEGEQREQGAGEESHSAGSWCSSDNGQYCH